MFPKNFPFFRGIFCKISPANLPANVDPILISPAAGLGELPCLCDMMLVGCERVCGRRPARSLRLAETDVMVFLRCEQWNREFVCFCDDFNQKIANGPTVRPRPFHSLTRCCSCSRSSSNRSAVA